MNNSSLTLLLEINNQSYIFFVCENDEFNNFKIVYNLELPLKGINNNSITDLQEVYDIIKKNVYTIEQKFNYTFNEITLILENFNPTFINLSGYKKLNGSQILRENITYILNSLKSSIEENDSKKKILHIFNSNFFIDKKKIDNLPIGLFGDFYSHELSFTLINLNDYKNLSNILDKINLKIKKILIKSFIKGANISNNYKKTDTFFHVKMNNNNSKIFYFENNSLKFEQNFKFGTDIIITDISKVTSLKRNTVEAILEKIDLQNNISEDELVKKELFVDEVYKKIKKKLIYDIIEARIQEITELILFKNVNFIHYNKISKDVFFEINPKSKLIFLVEIYKKIFSMYRNHNLIILECLTSGSMINTANKLIHFGWKNEAIPISQSNKSLIAKFFDRFFG